jgi:hypothetical protein
MDIAQNTLQDKIQFLSKTNLSTHDTSCFDQSDYQWRLGDMNGIKNILQDTLTVSANMLEQESKNYQLLENTINRDDQGKIDV